MAVEVTYTIPPQGNVFGNSIINGSIVDVTFQLSANPNADGSYTVIGATGTFETTQRTGTTITITGTDSITGVGQGLNNSGGASDNELFLVMDPDTMPIVTGGGVAFTISNTNDAANGTVDFYDNNGVARGTVPTDTPDYMQGGTGNTTSATDVTETADGEACFTSGTLIRTDRGDVEVERLAVGDLVVTASGAQRPIRWLGHRTITSRQHPSPHEAMTVRIAAHAFGPGKPARDLVVSPGHAICVDVVGEVLIPAGSLINGSTIQQVEVDEVTYWHVELDSHDVILAENLPTESYLDMGNRGFFREADVVDLAAGPDPALSSRTHADFCRPFHDGGAVVEAVKAQLAKRSEALGWSRSSAIDMHLEVDGRRLDPVVHGLTARFHVPADAQTVWLVSPTARPCESMDSKDRRVLGLAIGSLRIDDGLGLPRTIAIGDPLLCIGFHDVEDGCRRWTAGRARLPASLWEGCEDSFFLRVELAGLPVPRWVRPADVRREIRLIA